MTHPVEYKKSKNEKKIQAEKSSSSLTPQLPTLLEMVDPLAGVALAQFLAHQPGHHAAHPLLADDRVTGIVDGDVVLEVDAVVGRRNGGLLGQEGGGLGGGHCARRLSLSVRVSEIICMRRNLSNWKVAVVLSGFPRFSSFSLAPSERIKQLTAAIHIVAGVGRG